MNFCSDNVAPAHPAVMAALARANEIPALMPYGNDEITQRVAQRFNEIFEREVAVFPVATGTGANVLALSCLVPPFGAIYCHELAHIHADECGAPEFFTGGAKLVTLPGKGAKLEAAQLDRVLAEAGAGVVHHVQPAAISLTQASEAGCVYRAGEIGAIAEVARRHKLALHMDGARFANALASLNCKPADITWRAGVDALSFGATKNGALAAEAVVFFDKDKAAQAHFRRKRGGHLFSKLRFLSAQLDGYLHDDLWLKNARHSNAMARKLADGISAIKGVRLIDPVEANEIFVILPKRVIAALKAAGFLFYPWPQPGLADSEEAIRLVTAFNTQAAHVEQFVAVAAA